MPDSIIAHSDSNGQIRIFVFNGQQFRAFIDSDNVSWFIGPDATKALGYANSSQAIADNVDPDDKGYTVIEAGRDIPPISTRYIPGSTIVINESGLYSLILSSRKPEAKAFKRWITHEVLPAIRKTGSYSLQQMSPLQQLKAMVAHMEQTERQITELHEKQAEQALQIEAVTERLDNAEFFTILQWCQSQGIKSTPSVRQMWGKQASEMSRERGIERGSVVEGQYAVHTYHLSILLDVCRPKPKTNGQLPLLHS